jgi:hypothetical protein
MEQGKDIISIDNKGVPCAFQLKTGDIDLAEFRKIKGEIDELVEIHINFPCIRKDINHRAVLVTNGTITDPVRREIDDLNVRYKERGFSELEIRTKLDLLKDFLDVNRAFLPTDLLHFKHFLELLLYDGHKLVNKKSLANFIEKITLAEKPETKLRTKRRIASSLLLTEYSLSPFETTKNHVSIIEGWTLFCGYVLALAEKLSIEPMYWRQSYDLAIHKANSELDALKDEFFSRTNYLESAWDGGAIYKSRLVIVLGWLSARELYRKKIDPSYSVDRRVCDSIRSFEEKAQLLFWGESATPFFMAMSLLARVHSDNNLSGRLVGRITALIAAENNIDSNKISPAAFADPYYGPEQVLGSIYHLNNLNMKSFAGASYHIGSLVDMLVRNGNRKLLDNSWRDISDIRKCEFNPSPAWKMFTWRCDSGEQVENYYNRPQSWKELFNNATSYDLSNLARMLPDSAYAYYFVLCYPHRLTQKISFFIEKETT